MHICKYCIDALRSRGEKIYIGEEISQDIDFDVTNDKWISLYDEPILKCDFCGEIDSLLYECK